MVLGINGLRLTGQRLGVGRYVEYLLRNWSEAPAADQPFERIRVYVPRAPQEALPLTHPVEMVMLSPRLTPAMWEHAVLPAVKPRDTLFFCPSYIVPLLARSRPIVVTHLGSYEAIPSAFGWWERNKARLLYSRSCHRADVVITVSESSKRDIMKYYGLAAERIRVIPLGVDDVFRPIDDTERLAARRRSYFADGRPYVLFVGKLSARRHVPELLQAFARLDGASRRSHGLVLIGPDSTGRENVTARAAALGIGDRVKHVPFAGHAELLEAYNAADAFIYPSEYEGFGIPVLEAMACGTPAITLNNSAFPEFAGGVAHFARDGSADGLCEALDAVLSSTTAREQMRRDGPPRAEAYRWRHIARHTMELLRDVATN
jgi:glycosyltransferase involved in cell wall biosynthesis